MKFITIFLLIFWGVIACTVIIGNSNYLDRDYGIIIEGQENGNEQNREKKEDEEAHARAEEAN